MRAIIFLAMTWITSAASIQEMVDNLFDEYLPQKATWEAVKMCRAKCGEHEGCLATCPKYQCPFQHISAQCDLFNSSVAAFKACHHTCRHDSACHFKKCLPLAMPTSIKELNGLADHVLCSKTCGKDEACHGACPKHFDEKLAQCEKFEAVVACMKGSGSHSTCPHLDKETKMDLMQEPWSLPKDIANHVTDYLLPQEKDVSLEEVRVCHMKCGQDHECHHKCPDGPWKKFQDECSTLDQASACHSACDQSEIKCPFKETECHFKCPMSMPSSVKELKGLTDHVLCHTTCGQDKTCHATCPNSIWNEKKAQCQKYWQMVACHKGCGQDHSCHHNCPNMVWENGFHGHGKWQHGPHEHGELHHGPQEHGTWYHGAQEHGEWHHGPHEHGEWRHGESHHVSQEHVKWHHGLHQHGEWHHGPHEYGEWHHGPNARGEWHHGPHKHGESHHGSQKHGKWHPGGEWHHQGYHEDGEQHNGTHENGKDVIQTFLV